jgi:peptidoglycan/xylan/chitin deacetylase (PgdA/CDA1 family)
MDKEYLVSIGVHAEKLNDDFVWNEVHKVLDLADRSCMKMTFFVHPLYAILEGEDISERLREIYERGHEIGQHTHFYLKHPVKGFEKKPDLSPENIRHCIERDNDFLKRAGCRVRGFCAGAWIITKTVFQELNRLGFSYDCSARAFDLSYKPELRRITIKSQKPFMFKNSLLEIPTTSWMALFLFKHFTFRETKLEFKKLSYDIIHFHDYDLLNNKHRILFMLLTKFLELKRIKFATVGELGDRIRKLI